ncbi:hypothetical protein [Nocardia salmonicida]|uniref:hypothetical protein n=1 Tax=Nocardia salmonicida TaxID=53431 RepID=UPI0027D83693|nr:hypothetical protein [Nocardia salmonicida]
MLNVNDLDETLPGPVEWSRVTAPHRTARVRAEAAARGPVCTPRRRKCVRQTWLGIAAQLDSRSRDGKPE